MEKALLKVTRFNNSDVIATSGDTPSPDPSPELTCSHQIHFEVVNNNTTANSKMYEWIRESWSYYDRELVECPISNVTVGLTYGEDGKVCSNSYKHIYNDN